MSAYFTNVRNGWLMQDYRIINEIIESINARLPYESEDAIAPVEEGDNLQRYWSNEDVFNWRRMQSMIYDMVHVPNFQLYAWPRFVAIEGVPNYEHLDFSPLDTLIHGRITVTTGLPDDSPRDLWNLAELPMRFRRAVEYDPDVNEWTDTNDPMFIPFTTTGTLATGAGFVHKGDIIGPWLIEDMQKALDVITVAGFGHPYPNTVPLIGDEYSGTGKDEDSFSSAYTNAVNDWSLTDEDVSTSFFARSRYRLGTDEIYRVTLSRSNTVQKPPDGLAPASGTVMAAEKNGSRVVYCARFVKNAGSEDVFYNHGDDVAENPPTGIFNVTESTFIEQLDAEGTDAEYPQSSRHFGSSMIEADTSPGGSGRVRGYSTANNHMFIQPDMPYKIDRE